MKKWALVLVLFLSISSVFAEGAQSTATTSPTVSQNINFESCTKIFAINKEKLFYLILAGISANKFTINEIQSENGYVIFTAVGNKYLAAVGAVDSSNAILKITPCNDIYYFQSGIVSNMFKYVEVNLHKLG